MTETPQQAATRLTSGIGTLEGVYEYRDANDSLVFCNLRIRQNGSGKTFRMMSNVTGTFLLKRPNEKRPPKGWPLYGLASLAREGKVFVVEGEKCVDSIHALGMAAVTSGSTSTDEHADWSPLSGRDVVLWPDNDDAGRRYMDRVQEALHGVASKVERIDPGALGLGDKEDCFDWLAHHPEAGVGDVLTLVPKVRTNLHSALIDPRPKVVLSSDNRLMSAVAKELGEHLGDKLYLYNNEVVVPHAL